MSSKGLGRMGILKKPTWEPRVPGANKWTRAYDAGQAQQFEGDLARLQRGLQSRQNQLAAIGAFLMAASIGMSGYIWETWLQVEREILPLRSVKSHPTWADNIAGEVI